MNFKEIVLFLMFFSFFQLAKSADELPGHHRIPDKMINGRNWKQFVYDQSVASSCASCAVSDSLRYVHGENIHNFSTLYLHAATHEHNGNMDERYLAMGQAIKNVMEYAREHGVPPNLLPRENPFRQEQDLGRRLAFANISNIYQGNGTKVERIKRALVDLGFPVIVSVISQRGEEALFVNPANVYRKNAVPVNPARELNATPTKRHTIVIYGYSNAYRGFKIKNSWGESFLNNGRAILGYNYLERESEAAYIGCGANIIRANIIDNPIDISTNFFNIGVIYEREFDNIGRMDVRCYDETMKGWRMPLALSVYYFGKAYKLGHRDAGNKLEALWQKEGFWGNYFTRNNGLFNTLIGFHSLQNPDGTLYDNLDFMIEEVGTKYENFIN